MTHVTCRLTAKNLEQLRDPTLGNRVWATFIPTGSKRSHREFTSSWQNVAVSPDLWMIATTLELVPETIIYDPGAGKEHDVQCLRIGMEWPRRIYGRDCLTH